MSEESKNSSLRANASVAICRLKITQNHKADGCFELFLSQILADCHADSANLPF